MPAFHTSPTLQVSEVSEMVEGLVKERIEWTDVTKKFPIFGKERNIDS